MKGKWEWGILIFSIWLKRYKSNRTEMLLFRGKMFIKSKVVCIDLHAGPNEGRYGDLIVLQMHQRGLAGFLLSEWLAASCCYCPSSHWLNCLSHSQGTYWMQLYKTVLHNRPKLAHISENRNVIFLKSRGEIFPSLMFQFTTVPDPILLLSWKKAEYRPSESISSPEKIVRCSSQHQGHSSQ